MRSSILALSLVSLLALSLTACAAESSRPEVASESNVIDRPVLATFTSDAAGFDTHSYWLDTGSEVVVFDAQFTDASAEALLASIRRTTRSRIAFVVITHPNPDKFNGAEVFRREGAKVIASKRTAAALPGVYAYKKAYFTQVAKSFTEATYPKLATVDVTFEGTYRLPVKGQAIELRELANAGVSSSQTVAWIPGTKSLVVGDLVHGRAHAWLEGGIVDGAPKPDLAAWQKALEELSQFEGARVYGGRGEVLDLDVAIREERTYLAEADTIVARYVADLGARKSELSDPAKNGAHWKAITSALVARFPTYALPYMVEYGVYGLALSKVK